MEKNYLKAFNIESSEQSRVLLLLGLSVFLGIFSGSFDIGASSLFLDAFPYSMLPKAILISGFTGILITSLYSKLQSMISFSKLAIYNLLFVTIITVLLRIGYEISASKWLAFIAFVFFGPLNIVSIVGFWGLATRMFNLRQGKRLFGIIDTGQVVGIVISTFAIPVLLTFGLKIKNLLLISSVSALGALILVSFIVKAFPLETSTNTGTEKRKSGVGFIDLFKKKYTFYIVLFVSLSMITAFFIFNSFLSVSKVKYPDSSDFAKFLGVFTGTVMIFSIIIKTFVYSNLLKTYGLRAGLTLSPMLLGGLTILASIVGSFGYSADSRFFIFFFLMVTLSRLLSVSLKISIESPSSKLLYQCLDEDIRHDVQAKIDGVVNESAALLSGVILAILGSLSFIKLNHLTYILVGIAGAWIFVSWKLHAWYRKSLEENLEHSRKSDTEDDFKESIHETLVKKAILSPENENQQIHAILTLQAMIPLEFEQHLPALLKSDSSQVRDLALKSIEQQKILECISDGTLDNEKLTPSQKDLLRVLLQEKALMTKQDVLISNLKSRDVNKRMLATRYLGLNRNATTSVSTFTSLLHDAHNEVKASALIAAAQLKVPDFIPAVAECLDHPSLGNIAYMALLKYGKDVLDPLEQHYYKTGVSVQTQVQIVKIMGDIGGDKATGMLTEKINSANIRLLNQVVLSLLKCNYRFSETHRIDFNNALQLILSVIAWNLSVLQSSEHSKLPESFIQAIEDGIRRNYELLYNILSLIYDADSVRHVRQNIETGTTESIGYALELMDIFIDEELKPMLIPFFEDSSLTDKVRNLQNFFPIQEMTQKELLLSVMNKDYNHIGLWTKICAIDSYRSLDEGITDDLVSLLFHPDKVIHETAALVVNEKNRTKINEIGDRIQPTIRKSIEESLILAANNNYYLNYTKVLFLKQLQLFSIFQGEELLSLAKSMLILSKSSMKVIHENYGSEGLYFMITGMVNIKHKNGVIRLTDSDSADTSSVNTDGISVELTDDAMVYFIPRSFYNKFLFDHKDAEELLTNLNIK